MKKKVLLRAPALSISGYGTHARQIFRYLKSKDIDLSVDLLSWGITSWHVNPDNENGLVGEIMKRSGTLNGKPDVVISLQLPNEWQRVDDCVNVGMSAIVESDKCNEKWVDACNSMSRVIVPSQFAKKVLSSSGNLTGDVRVVGESFPDEVLNCNDKLSLSEIQTKTNLLVVGQLTGMKPDVDRKNLFYTIKWFCEEFKNNKDVGLIIKSNLGTNCSIHRAQLENIFKTLLDEVRGDTFPRVHLINGEMTTNEIVSMYRSNSVKALLSLTRGEGFGLPLLEAAACNLPIICTDWSGHLDFMRLGKYTAIDYDLIPVPEQRIDNEIFVKGTKWAFANEKDAKKKMRKFVDSQEVPKQWAVNLGEKIREKYSFESISKQYDNELGDLL